MGAPTDVLSRIDEIESELARALGRGARHPGARHPGCCGTRCSCLATPRAGCRAGGRGQMTPTAAPVAQPEAPVATPPPVAPRAPSIPARPSIPAKPAKASGARSAAQLAADWDLLGPRGFAIIGGAVTAFGIILLFVLAANRGWITPEMRVAFGAASRRPPSALRSGCARATASCRCRSAPPAQASRVATQRLPPRPPVTSSCPTGWRCRSRAASRRSPS